MRVLAGVYERFAMFSNGIGRAPGICEEFGGFPRTPPVPPPYAPVRPRTPSVLVRIVREYSAFVRKYSAFVRVRPPPPKPSERRILGFEPQLKK